MELLIKTGMMLLGFVLLIKGADWFVDGAAGIACKLKIPQLVIGLTIVAMGTSLPEAAVSISSALKGNADITIGNIVGSNILNVLIILGLTSVITALKVTASTIRYEIPYMIAITVALLIFGCTKNCVSLLEGVVLLILFIVYLGYIFRMTRKQSGNGDVENINTPDLPAWRLVFLIVAGMAMVVLGSNFTVDGATAIAESLGISERFIALTIVAFGTSLPELVTSVISAKKGNADIAIGNIVGSNIYNILFIVGTSAVITPVAFTANFAIDTIVAIAVGIILLSGVIRRKKLTRGLGLFMLICYVAYFIYLL